MEELQWKPIIGYENEYLVSNMGDVYSCNSDLVLAAYVGVNSYPRVILYHGGNFRSTHDVHVLIADAFLGGHREYPWEVNHKDGIKTNSVLSNLEWVTHSRNQEHAYELGLSKSGYPLLNGDRHPNAKLDWEKVKAIRLLRKEGDFTSKEIGEMFGVSYRTILKVCSGEMWKEDLEESRKDLDYVPSEFSWKRGMTDE